MDVEARRELTVLDAVSRDQHITQRYLAAHLGIALCRALGIDKRHNAHDLLSDDFFITQPHAETPIAIIKRPRIGVDYAGRWAKRHLRFYIKGNPHVSRP